MSGSATSAGAFAGMVSLLHLDPGDYVPHPVHIGAGGSYTETNCYADVILELLHARGDEPLAVMGATARLDFEGDQWTFFKPHPADLEELLGVDIHEMQPYRPLPSQIAEQLHAGRTIIVELDAFHLPDTASTSYGRAHVKTSVAVEAIDVGARRMRYFHNSGLHELQGADFAGVFRLDGPVDEEVLPPYTELVRFDAGPRLRGSPLRDAARERFAVHLAHRPSSNPFHAFGAQLQDALPRLVDGDVSEYHAYAFATVRMAGAGFELLGAQANWMFDSTQDALEPLTHIVEACKVLSFKLARRRPFDARPAVDAMAADWDLAMRALDALAG